MPKSINKLSKHKKLEILQEIKRLTKVLYDDDSIDRSQIKSMVFIINNLATLAQEGMSVDEFHRRMESASERIRQFYYELLFE